MTSLNLTLLAVCLLAIIVFLGDSVDGYRQRSQLGAQLSDEERLASMLQSHKGQRNPIVNPESAKGRKTSNQKPNYLGSNPFYHPNEIRGKRSVDAQVDETMETSGDASSRQNEFKKTQLIQLLVKSMRK
jgi:hypothetical protein